ncbi:MAG TPA: hypothetical protein VKP64_01150 [Mycobacteriales bacterium]|nr:hypothetical protein [Mycobacteriales bacterium]
MLAGYFVAYLAWHLLSGAAGHERLVISDAANVPVSAAAAVLAVGCARAAEADPRTRRAWWFIAAAMVFQTWGDVAWFWFDAVRGVDAYPSVADIGYLGLYPLLLAGLLLLPRRHRSRREHAMLGLDAAVVLGGFMVIWAFSLGPALHAHRRAGGGHLGRLPPGRSAPRPRRGDGGAAWPVRADPGSHDRDARRPRNLGESPTPPSPTSRRREAGAAGWTRCGSPRCAVSPPAPTSTAWDCGRRPTG